jgi:cell division transport system permease protein
MKAVRAHLHAWRRAWAIARATPLLSLLVVVALATALALPLFAAAVAEGALAAVARIDAKPTVSVFLAAQAGPKERESAERALRGLPGVASVRFIPRDAALAELASIEGMGDIVGGLDGNPLPDTLVATLADADPGTASAVAGRIRSIAGVAGVQSDVAWVTRLASIARAVRWVGALLGALMAVAVVAATFAAARLQALTHRQAIAVATLLGATRRWVARPYVLHGMLQGGAAGLGAAGIVAAAIAGLGGILRPTFPSVADLVALPALPWTLAAVAVGALLGFAGAWLATRDLSSSPAAG